MDLQRLGNRGIELGEVEELWIRIWRGWETVDRNLIVMNNYGI